MVATVAGDAMNRRIGIGLVGVGSHARRNLLPTMAASDVVNLVGVSSRNAASRDSAAADWACRAYASFDEMLDDSAVAVVYISVPVGLHSEHALRALEAGKHVWCEKSLTATEDQWRRLLARARTLDLSLCEAYMFRFHPQFSRLRQLVAEGAIGRLRNLTARFGFPHLPRDNCRYSPTLGGGALLDAGGYPLAAARKLARSMPLDVCALLESDAGYEVDTAGSALMRFSGGEHAHLEWGFGRTYINEITMWGDGGTIHVDRAFSKPPDLVTTITIHDTKALPRKESIPPANHFSIMLAAFAETVTGRAAREREWTEVEQQGQVLFEVRGRASVVEQPRIDAGKTAWSA